MGVTAWQAAASNERASPSNPHPHPSKTRTFWEGQGAEGPPHPANSVLEGPPPATGLRGGCWRAHGLPFPAPSPPLPMPGIAGPALALAQAPHSDRAAAKEVVGTRRTLVPGQTAATPSSSSRGPCSRSSWCASTARPPRHSLSRPRPSTSGWLEAEAAVKTGPARPEAGGPGARRTSAWALVTPPSSVQPGPGLGPDSGWMLALPALCLSGDTCPFGCVSRAELRGWPLTARGAG